MVKKFSYGKVEIIGHILRHNGLLKLTTERKVEDKGTALFSAIIIVE